MSQYWKIALIGVSVFALSACGPKHGPNGATVMDAQSGQAAANDQDAASYGISDDALYQGNRTGFYKNPMKAPANQVYYFSFNSSQLRPQDSRALMVQANYLASHPSARIRLEGNTDDRGSREYNVGLGWRRDQTVARLLEQQGVRPQQIQMISYGKERPVVQGENERAWALNRRVNLVYKVTG